LKKGRVLSLSKGRVLSLSKGRVLSLSKGRVLSLSKGDRRGISGRRGGEMVRNVISSNKEGVMRETIDAIYENGVLRPLHKLHILDGKRIRVTVEAEYEEKQTSDPGAKPPFSVVRRALSRCSGSMADDVAAEREDRA